MTHYFCSGSCAGVSDKPGTCQAQTCEKHDHPLESCECVDGRHGKREASEEDKMGKEEIINDK